ncbi:hypothetical protein SH668x_000647 [Planctomicrobium sp. SH668]|uniref:hypothetical protein n=1 Tax=Planctomicrobium sp. SH668 TaxID=3448126 RepID=UPI003F5BECC0
MAKSGEQQKPEEEFFPTTAAQIQRWLPWVRLLRGFRIAIDFRRMVIALLAVFAWGAVDSALRFADTTRQSISPGVHSPSLYWAYVPPLSSLNRDEADMRALENLTAVQPPNPLSAPYMLWPMTRIVMEPRVSEPLYEEPVPWQQRCVFILAGFVISALFGGAICRMAAVDFSGHGEISIREALGFSLSRIPAYVGAPLIAGCGLGGLWLANSVLGFVASAPVLGEWLVALFWFVALFIGLGITLIFIGIVLGWPLMIAGISADGGDAFDGLGRSYSYLMNRPLYAFFLVAFLVVYGSILLFVVEGISDLTMDFTQRSVSTGHIDLNSDLPAQSSFLDRLTGGMSKGMDQGRVTNLIYTFWSQVFHKIPAAFVFSYFWTMVTISYFLLRKREDGTPMDEVWMPKPAGPRTLPVVGIPAAELREKNEAENSKSVQNPASEESTPPQGE